MTVVSAVSLLVGVLILVSGLLARAEKLPLNYAIGIRIPSLLQDPESWKRGHKAAWSQLFIGGLGPVIAGAVSFFLPPSVMPALTIAALLWMLGWVLYATRVATKAVSDAPRS